MGGISKHYLNTFEHKFKKYNKPMQLPDYFGSMIGDKKHVRIAELGSGPVVTIGNSWPGVEVDLFASDELAFEYEEQLWNKYGVDPLIPIDYRNFERTYYPENYFDIVHCRNAIDHTKNFHRAIEEMKRICRPGGWIYLAHAPSQKTRFGGHHYWDYEKVPMPDFFLSYDGELIVHTWQKP